MPRRYLAANGVDCAILVERSARGALGVRSSCEAEWMADHERDMRAGCEPFMRWCLPTHRSLPTGYDHHHRYPYLAPSDRAIIAEAHERTGLRAGRSVILRADPTGVGATSGWHLLTERSGAEFERQFAEDGEKLALACHMIAIRMSAPADDTTRAGALAIDCEDAGSRPPLASREGDGRPRLSPRERECLQFVASGQRMAEIAHRLGLATGTVELHLANARKRLGARTTGEAVARALTAREIAP